MKDSYHMSIEHWAGLSALLFAMLSGPGLVWAQDSLSSSTSGSVQVDSPNKPSADVSRDGSYARWKSCVELLHPRGNQSASEIRAMFESPRNNRQLLQNLKVAADHRLLLQPSFYDVANLLEFFNGSKVNWIPPDLYSQKLSTGTIKASIVSDTFPRLSIVLESNCKVVGTNDDGVKTEDVSANGFLNLALVAEDNLTLRHVRSVFGIEAQRTIDNGVSPDGNTYAPTEKGSVTYLTVRNVDGEDSRIKLLFYFRPNAPRTIDDDDVVARISMQDMRYHKLGSR